MSTAEKIVQEYCQLSPGERNAVFMEIVAVNAQDERAQFPEVEQSRIENVLKERMNGPFEPFPENWAQDLIAKGDAIHAEKIADAS